jgi:hypothetical protein
MSSVRGQLVLDPDDALLAFAICRLSNSSPRIRRTVIAADVESKIECSK